MNNVHFGAGNIGRGFIGKLLRESEFEVTFVDVNPSVIDLIQQRGEYQVELLADEPIVDVVKGVKGLHSLTQEEEVIQALQSADLITTSVGVNILPRIAPVLAKALEGLNKNINIIACENALNASDQLRDEVQKLIKIPEPIHFLNAAVDRIVPTQSSDDLLYVKVEPFYEWVIETNEPLPIKGATFVDNLYPYIQRKLFTVNTGHAAIAYYGYQQGYKTITEAVNDTLIESFLGRVLQETGQYLIQTYDFDAKKHQAYQEQTIARFKNRHIIDPITRIARNPMRKLSANDRLVFPAVELNKLGQMPKALIECIVYALAYDEPSDEEAQEVQAFLHVDVSKAITKLTSLAENHPLHQLILTTYHDTITSR